MDRAPPQHLMYVFSVCTSWHVLTGCCYCRTTSDLWTNSVFAFATENCSATGCGIYCDKKLEALIIARNQLMLHSIMEFLIIFCTCTWWNSICQNWHINLHLVLAVAAYALRSCQLSVRQTLNTQQCLSDPSCNLICQVHFTAEQVYILGESRCVWVEHKFQLIQFWLKES